MSPTAIPQFDMEMNEQFEKEKSRLVKCCMLKSRCVIMFTFMIIFFFYITIKEVTDKEEIINSILSIANIFTNTSSSNVVSKTHENNKE